MEDLESCQLIPARRADILRSSARLTPDPHEATTKVMRRVVVAANARTTVIMDKGGK